jgi:catechol 2,3-dioxygenase-like lactoylglutathione lyase family enzyme
VSYALPVPLDVLIIATSIDRALKFYVDLLGMIVINDRMLPVETMASLTAVDGAEMRVCVLAHPDARGRCGTLQLLEWHEPSGMPPTPAPIRAAGSTIVCFTVADLVGLVERLVAADVESYSPVVGWTFPDGRRMSEVYVHGPDGVTIALVEFHDRIDPASHGGYQVTVAGHGSDAVSGQR